MFLPQISHGIWPWLILKPWKFSHHPHSLFPSFFPTKPLKFSNSTFISHSHSLPLHRLALIFVAATKIPLLLRCPPKSSLLYFVAATKISFWELKRRNTREGESEKRSFCCRRPEGRLLHFPSPPSRRNAASATVLLLLLLPPSSSFFYCYRRPEGNIALIFGKPPFGCSL